MREIKGGGLVSYFTTNNFSYMHDDQKVDQGLTLTILLMDRTGSTVLHTSTREF